MTAKTVLAFSTLLAACSGSSHSHDMSGPTNGDIGCDGCSNKDLSASLDGSTVDASGDALAHEMPPANGFYIYQDDDGTGARGLNAEWDVDYSFGTPPMPYPAPGGGTADVNYVDTQHPESGHKYALYIPGMVGWQPASTNYGGTDNGKSGPYGFDLSGYTYLTFDLYTAHASDQFDSAWEYDGDVGSAQADQPAPAYVNDIHTVPGVGTINANAWNTEIKIPLAFVGHLGIHGVYKLFLRDNSNNESWWDNVGFLPGDYSWIYDGGAASGWDSSANTWNHDPATLLGGWSDASTGLTANYSASPDSLAVKSGLNGLLNPGQVIESTKVIELDVTAKNATWKVKHSGFTTAPYTTLTFGLLPTNSTHSYMVALYDTSGTMIGSAIDPSKWTNNDFGPNTNHWTIYCIPFTAFGSVPDTIGGVSIEDTSGLGTNTIYVSAPGFFD